MLARLRPRSAYDVMAALALFLVVAGGSAYALDGSNTVFSDDIVDGEVKTPDINNAAVVTDKLAQGAVTSGKVKNENLTGTDVFNGSLSGADVNDNSLTGNDVFESSLAEVPSAAVGGRGAASIEFTCDPDDGTFVSCGFVNLNVPAGASGTRALLVARIEAVQNPTGEEPSRGFCRLVTSTVGPVPNSTVPVLVRFAEADHVPLIGVTPPLIPGQINAFGIECSQDTQFFGEISFREAAIEAVLINF